MGVACVRVGNLRARTRIDLVFCRVGASLVRPAPCCSCSPAARACRRTSAQRLESFGGCGGFWAVGARGSVARGLCGGVRGTHGAARAAATRAGIRFDHISFAYPGTITLVARRLSLELPGRSRDRHRRRKRAGNSTLRKLIAKMYEPTAEDAFSSTTRALTHSGGGWRARMAGAFQDFFKFELPSKAQRLGFRLAAYNDAAAVSTSVTNAPRRRRGRHSPASTRTRSTWPGGARGQLAMSKAALARGYSAMLHSCWCFETTAALELRDRAALSQTLYAAAAARTRRRPAPHHDSRITPPIPESVRMADLIVGSTARRCRHRISQTTSCSRAVASNAPLYGSRAAAYR